MFCAHITEFHTLNHCCRPSTFERLSGSDWYDLHNNTPRTEVWRANQQ